MPYRESTALKISSALSGRRKKLRACRPRMAVALLGRRLAACIMKNIARGCRSGRSLTVAAFAQTYERSACTLTIRVPCPSRCNVARHLNYLMSGGSMLSTRLHVQSAVISRVEKHGDQKQLFRVERSLQGSERAPTQVISSS